MPAPPARQTFGLPALDALLGGGLRPGTLTVLAGATGAGKTQLGVRWAEHGRVEEGRRGVICDLTSRGDAQDHATYALDRFGWRLEPYGLDGPFDPEAVWDFARSWGEYLHPFARAGRRVTRRDLDEDDWHAWKTDLARVLRASAGFFYGHFIRGARRVVIDGIEPAERAAESIQFEFFEYLYQHVIRKDHDWAARELFREHYRGHEAKVGAHAYEAKALGCVYLYTTPHVLIDDMMSGPIGEGDVFANANTVIYLGRTRHDGRMGRALHVAKHRGSACSDDIVPYRITDQGLVFD
jgi:KaiC/GvpD/RAD55 family RecA-like ATPase